MFYRRKLVLALLQTFGGKLDKINLQKLLFLLCQQQKEPTYEFIPYLFGCYSYSAKADLNTMVEKGFLAENDIGYSKKDKKNYLTQLNEHDRKLVNKIYLLFNKMDSDALMKYTYSKFPYYAINSTVAPKLLTKKQLEIVNASRPTIEGVVLYTAGYEGISLEAYLNKLIEHGITLLADVRNNPLSQKFGFSKSQLERYCMGINIEYLHFPDVGIQSEMRQELNDQNDYNNLFKIYRQTTLTKTLETQNKILTLLKEKKRIALTCFEADINRCHRKHLAESITQLPGWNFQLKHI